MANSIYEYTRNFERQDNILPNTWIVIRLDGHAFHKFSAKYDFEKPNDKRALDLMNRAAQSVLAEIPDICIAYGHSDEYSFVLHPSCQLYERRESKLTSTIVSIFTANYVFSWPDLFPEKQLSAPLPSFDARAVVYPSLQNLRDYLSWRQADCHINNLYNTVFWALALQGGLGRTAAEKKLSGTLSAEKHEILFSNFGINYNNEPELFRKGSTIFHDYYISMKQPVNRELPPSTDPAARNEILSNSEETTVANAASPSRRTDKKKTRPKITVVHADIIGKDFWQQYPWILMTGSERKRVLKDVFSERFDESEPG